MFAFQFVYAVFFLTTLKNILLYLVAQTVMRLPTMPTMWETQVQSLGQEDLLEKEMATHSSILARKSHGWWNLVGCSPWGYKESDTTERFHFTYMVQPHLYSVLYVI